ncbi:hypothetical protein E2562_028771 [Oryza meyeriana var. granulata]|uniref:Uncharacterized protein n=1 Tax=Oryza meyeriana var. granulata TaxID=110450 RepID=A0A6G1FCX3_9ORYZ|nr:hypothetical protein E2562_028771 [Oryza meyeriana var. granulata]
MGVGLCPRLSFRALLYTLQQTEPRISLNPFIGWATVYMQQAATRGKGKHYQNNNVSSQFQRINSGM